MIESKIFTRIFNKKNFIVSEIPNYHPDSLKYRNFWKLHIKRIFEGCWIPDTQEINIDIAGALDYEELSNNINHSWRWITPGLYFYINFGTILHKPEDAPRTMPKFKIRPYLSDLELAFFYNWIEARGFSGFEDDDEFSCNRDIPLFDKGKVLTMHPTCYKANGEVKTYITAREYLRRLNTRPLGRPLYWNEAKNLMLLSARGLGKSFLVAVGVILHEIITDGAKYYDESYTSNPPKNELFVGSGIAAKSSDLLSKTKEALTNLPGIWKQGTIDEKPSPLYKHMKGTLQPNNMKNPWRHAYDKKIGGEWKEDAGGSGSNIKHGVFTAENPEASAGGRYSVLVIEEVGLTDRILTAHGSSDATMRTDGTDKYGSAIYIGTGGNIEKVVGAEIIFRDPAGFDMLEFEDEWENTGSIGWFIPAYYADRGYKDENGNTKIAEAYAHYEQRRVEKKKAKSGSALDLEMMNYPLIPSEMFLNKGANNYPLADLKHRLAELMTNDKILNATYKGRFVISEDGEVKWNNEDKTPIREYPLKTDNVEGCVEMFFLPQRDATGSIPYGRYIAALDPIDDDDNTDNTLSLQSFFIFDLWTEKIVLEYSARTKFAKDFYEQCRRGLLYYNARLLYENQKKGVFTYFDAKNSLYLLEDTPPELRDMDMQRGSTVGNKGKGVYGTPGINKWGRAELGPAWMNSQAVGRPEGVSNASIQLSVGLIREAIFYSPTMNADRISAFGLLMIFREVRIKYRPEKEAKAKASYTQDKFFQRTYGYRQQNKSAFS